MLATAKMAGDLLSKPEHCNSQYQLPSIPSFSDLGPIVRGTLARSRCIIIEIFYWLIYTEESLVATSIPPKLALLRASSDDAKDTLPFTAPDCSKTPDVRQYILRTQRTLEVRT